MPECRPDCMAGILAGWGCLRYGVFELAVIQAGIEAALGQKLLVVAAFHHVAVPEDQNQVCVANGAEPVGNDEGGAVSVTSMAA